MRTPRLAILAILAFTLASPLHAQETAAQPLLKPSDRDALSALFCDYFRIVHDAKENKKRLSAYKSLEEDLKKKAKAAKIGTLLESPVDLRSAMCGPILPDKQLKKGSFNEEKTTIELMSRNVELRFLYRVPKAYTEKTLYPLVIALHPQADKSDAVKKWAESAFGEAVLESSVIIVPLNLTALDWASEQGIDNGLFPLGNALKRFTIDRGRIILDGQGSAASAVVEYATRYPGFFTAAVVREPVLPPPPKPKEGEEPPPPPALPNALLANARHIPFLLIGSGGGDSAAPLAAFAKDCEAAGIKTKSAQSAISLEGRLDDAAFAALASFVAESRKLFAPRDIRFTTTSARQKNAYWLEMTDVEVIEGKSVTVEAHVDRTANEFQIVAPINVRSLTIYLNQDLIDMGKEFKILLTTKGRNDDKPSVRFQGRKGHDLDQTLETWFYSQSGNIGEVYTNKVEIEAAP